MMDWMSLGSGIVGLIGGAYGAFKRQKAKRAEEAVKAVEDAAIKAIEREIDDMMETMRISLARFDERAGGAGVMAELELKRKYAIDKGREAALKAYQEKMKGKSK